MPKIAVPIDCDGEFCKTAFKRCEFYNGRYELCMRFRTKGRERKLRFRGWYPKRCRQCIEATIKENDE